MDEPRDDARVPARGLEGVVAGETKTSHVDGVNGMLIYQGYDIHDLAEHTLFAEVAHLMWYGRLPTGRASASRTVGWLAHVKEQYADNRLIRPTSKYVGPWTRTVAPIAER